MTDDAEMRHDDFSDFKSTLENRFRASGYILNDRQIERFYLYKRKLTSWNEKFNITSVSGDLEIINKHFLASVDLLRHLDFKGEVKVADVGSGGGFPGLPLKICVPDIQLTLIESSQKKAAFLKMVSQSLSLSGVQVIDRRAEEVGQTEGHRGKYDVVLSRYVASLPTLVEYSLPLVKTGGIFVAYKYGDISQEIMAAHWAIQLLGGRLSSVKDCRIPGDDTSAKLVFISKVEATPQRYPRISGAAKKRPLKKPTPKRNETYRQMA